jgi:hypothetical protein
MTIIHIKTEARNDRARMSRMRCEIGQAAEVNRYFSKDTRNI